MMPYFRYDIYKKQQALLSHLAGRFGSQALILYAAPALNDVNDLVDAKRQKKLIEHTNFRPAADLDNHHRNTYIRKGMHSIACSEPERFDSFDLLAKLKEFEGVRQSDNRSFIKKFADEVRTSVLEDDALGGAFQGELSEYVEAGIDRYPLLFAMISMQKFRELSGVQWLVAAADES